MTDSTEDEEETKERSYGSLMMETLTGSENGRIDHMLQVSTRMDIPILQSIFYLSSPC